MTASALALVVAALFHPQPDSTHSRTMKASEVRAARLAQAIVIDGDLSDAAWQGAQTIAGFTQREPNEGKPASQQTTVRVAFDDDALYISAQLHDTAPDSVVSALARRDRFISSDRFTLFLDPYHDRRTGFFFGINAAGTLYDGTLYNDDWDDDTWDGVWEGQARRTSDGWAVEMRIPYSQLRFAASDRQTWGVNFKRDIARNNERSYLVVTPSSSSGFVSRFADLVGLDGIKPPARLEVLPYVTSRTEFLDHAEGDPFHNARVLPGAGADVKFGLGGNLTLDGTINPDFGQVEVDPAVVNLSDVEVFFEEKRPFFIEGANIFNFGQGGANNFWGFNSSVPDFLYTRRIGRAPQGGLSMPDGAFADVPSGTHILGAAKLSGKIGNWSVGTLSALTKREYARIDAGGLRSRAEVEPMTYYGTARALKEFGEGWQGLGLISTAAIRSFGDGGLRNDMNSAGFALGMDGWSFLDRDKTWVVTGWTGLSHVRGSTDRITALQRNSVHYFQRPDAGHVEVDPDATSLSGLAGRFSLNKQKGRLYTNTALGFVDPNFDVNDLGFQSRSDVINAHQVVGYRWNTPTSMYRRLSVNASHFRSWDFQGNPIATGYWSNFNGQLRNFYSFYMGGTLNPTTVSNRRTRGGPLMLNPRGGEFSGGIDSDDRHPVFFGVGGYGGRYQAASDRSWGVNAYVEWKPMQQLSLRLSPALDRNVTSAQYVSSFDDPTASATFGQRYVFAALDQTTLSSSVRLNWIFSPKLSLEVYAQPLVSSGEYTDFKELARPKSFEFNRYGEGGSTFDAATGVADPDGPDGAAAPLAIGNPDFTFASLRGNAVLRWEYLPGSTLFLVWTQSRQDNEEIGDFRAGHSLGRVFTAKADNILMVKLSYWWNP
jgi:hypothetical protein